MEKNAYVVLGRSGSMLDVWNDTTGGLTNFVAQLDPDTKVTLVDFDDRYTIHPVQLAGEFRLPDEIRPRGSTALLDAVGATLSRALNEKNSDCRVTLCILSDGQENSSREYRHAAVRDLIEKVRHAAG